MDVGKPARIPRGSALDPFKPAIDQIIAEDDGLPRMYAPEIYRQLVAKGMAGVSKETVAAYVNQQRRSLRAEFIKRFR